MQLVGLNPLHGTNAMRSNVDPAMRSKVHHERTLVAALKD